MSLGEAFIRDHGLECPRLGPASMEQGFRARVGASAAKGAFAPGEVDAREAAGGRRDYLLRASGQTLTATGTVIHEAVSGEPRQSHMDGFATGSDRQKSTPG
jgi:hypothetical protein